MSDLNGEVIFQETISDLPGVKKYYVCGSSFASISGEDRSTLVRATLLNPQTPEPFESFSRLNKPIAIRLGKFNFRASLDDSDDAGMTYVTCRLVIYDVVNASTVNVTRYLTSQVFAVVAGDEVVYDLDTSNIPDFVLTAGQNLGVEFAGAMPFSPGEEVTELYGFSVNGSVYVNGTLEFVIQ